MEDGKEDSTIDTFPSLSFLSARLLYYINLNCMYNLQKAIINPFYVDVMIIPIVENQMMLEITVMSVLSISNTTLSKMKRSIESNI